MSKHLALFVLLIGLLTFAFVASCSCDDDDDDDNDVADDDNENDDDNAADDDAADDDQTDDDIFDDDDVDDDDNTTDDDDDTSAGTWTDSSTGLVWQDPPAGEYVTWEEAKNYCQNLTLAGGGWRLPTISELRSLIRGCDATATDGECGVTDDCRENACWNDSCSGCPDLGGPGIGGAYWPENLAGNVWFYWSSSAVPNIDDYAWNIGFRGAVVGANFGEGNSGNARCVR